MIELQALGRVDGGERELSVIAPQLGAAAARCGQGVEECPE
jgi:hypothetical protein